MSTAVSTELSTRPGTRPSRVARGATALFGGRRSLRPSPYLVFGTLFWVVMSAAAWRIPMCCDFGQHAAVVERLKADLPHPAHPTVDLPGAGSAYYSPYAVAQGLFAQVSGLAGWQVVKLAGPVNLLLLLTGLNRFVKVLTPRPWAPVLALAAMVLLWGTQTAWFSGFLGLFSMTGNLSYPSTFAIGLAFWIWSLTDRPAPRTDSAPPAPLWRYAALGVLIGVAVLVHPLTAVATLIGVAALVAGRERGLRHARVLGRWALAGAGAVVVAGSWPYFSTFELVELVGLGGDQGWDQAGNQVSHRAVLDAMHRRIHAGAEGHFWLALIGLPALWLRWQRDRRDPLVLMFAGDLLVIAYGWISGHYTYGRILGLALLPLQFALAVELAEAIARPRPWPASRRFLAQAAAVGAGLGGVSPILAGPRRLARHLAARPNHPRTPSTRAIRPHTDAPHQTPQADPQRSERHPLGLLTQGGAVVPRALDPVGFKQPPRWPTYAWAARHIGHGEVVLTDGYRPKRSLPGYGPNLVAPTWPDTSLPEAERQRRKRDVAAYLAPDSTRAERAAVVRRYDVRWLLLAPDQRAPEEAVVVAWGPRTGEVLARVGARRG
ncbi:hypothetical protein [Streptomyces sp. NPDC002851]